MKKVVSPCFCKVHTRSGNEATARAFCEIQFENGRLSITGVIGPLRSGDCRGGAGQCVDEIREGCPCDEWTQEMLDKFCSIWDEWHLNDMRPYCKHQKELGWDKLAVTPVTLYHYRLNSKTLGWLNPDEHPDGILGKPCPVCGYQYGHAWQTEEVPQEVIDWLFNLPESPVVPAWV